MAQIINTNVASLTAQRNLNSSQSSLQTSLQRLSSGLRINSAKDDAAGLAISERFTTQIRGMNVAMRNASDGISLAQTAEGALGEIGNNLQRIRELAVQSRNATNSDSDRQALDAEVQELMNEIQRVAEQTTFNDRNLLDGSFTDAVFQVGANQGQTITVTGVANANINQLGEWTSPDTIAAVETTFDASGVTFTNTDDDGYDAFQLSVGGTTVNVGPVAAGADDDATHAALATAIASAVTGAGIAGLSASAEDGEVTFSNATDAAITIEDTDDVLGADVTVAAGTSTAGTEQSGFAGENVLNADAADRMILAMDAALTAINGSRAELGAVQNRFESVVANLSTNSENLSASRSRILDADFAAETANLTRAQILQQAGTAMLAQANSLPQNVLSLLR